MSKYYVLPNMEFSFQIWDLGASIQDPCFSRVINRGNNFGNLPRIEYSIAHWADNVWLISKSCENSLTSVLDLFEDYQRSYD